MPVPSRLNVAQGYLEQQQRLVATGTERERRLLSSAAGMRLGEDALTARFKSFHARGMAIDEAHHFADPTMPSVFKANESPYYALLPKQNLGDELDDATAHTHLVIKNFRHPEKGIIEAIVPQRPADEHDKLLIHEEHHPGTKKVRFRDFSCGAFTRIESLSSGKFDEDGMESRSYGQYVERSYYDPTGTKVIGTRVLNDWMVIADCRDIVSYVLEEGPRGFPLRVWGRKNSDVTCCTFFNDDGARTHCGYTDGRISMYTGSAGRERQVSVTKDPERHGGVVREFYAGPAGCTYMTRQLFEDGTINFYTGTTPNLVRLVKKWHPSGKTERYEGEHRCERKVGEGFEPRDGLRIAAPPPANARARGTTTTAGGAFVSAVSSAASAMGKRLLGPLVPAPAGPQAGTELRVGTDHPRSDLHGKRFALTKPVGGDVWEFRWLDAPAPKLTKGQAAWSIALAQTVTNEAYFEARAAKEAARAAKAESSKAKKRAQRQAKQLEADARLAAKLQADEDEAARAPPPGPPLKGKHHALEALVRCPIDGAPLTDAVLASDGWVYNKGALQDFWCAHEALVSPITGVEVTNVLFAHNPLRSLAKELRAAPAKGKAVPTEEPELVLCPITHEVMEAPVLAEDGYIYDKAALAQWFATGATISPLTGAPMGEAVCLDNHVAVLCRAWL